MWQFNSPLLLAKYEMTEEESNEASRVLERQESIEKQQIYEDAFMEQMEKYLQFGEYDSMWMHLLIRDHLIRIYRRQFLMLIFLV